MWAGVGAHWAVGGTRRSSAGRLLPAADPGHRRAALRAARRVPAHLCVRRAGGGHTPSGALGDRRRGSTTRLRRADAGGPFARPVPGRHARRRVGLAGRRGPAAVLASAAAITIAPWTAYASMRAGEFVPVTTAGPSSLFIGTYLPGNGTTVGFKRALGDEAKRLNPRFRGTPNSELQAQWVLDVIAARHPDLKRDAAIALEARQNLVRYGLRHPLKFGAMMLDKGLERLWSRYARGGARQESVGIRAWHIVLVLSSFSGLAVAVVRRRSLLLATILTTAATLTAVHMLAVSQARYNLPLMPALIAGGVTGWFLLARPVTRDAG